MKLRIHILKEGIYEINTDDGLDADRALQVAQNYVHALSDESIILGMKDFGGSLERMLGTAFDGDSLIPEAIYNIDNPSEPQAVLETRTWKQFAYGDPEGEIENAEFTDHDDWEVKEVK